MALPDTPLELFEGRIVRILSDDLKGDKHQRFIMEEPSGRTLLVAHNIDIAPRVERLFEGGKIRVFGEYEPNDLGGIIHWTHHDPEQRIEGGWIEFRRKRYA
ncbi:MAG: DUF3465 domain-containing protein [Rhodothermales bacterium]